MEYKIKKDGKVYEFRFSEKALFGRGRGDLNSARKEYKRRLDYAHYPNKVKITKIVKSTHGSNNVDVYYDVYR